jgi:serine protease Do
LLSFFAVCFAFKGQATTIPDIVAKAKPAVVQVIALDANWSPIRTGTGFFVSADGDLLTNFHVIQGATHISARTNKGTPERWWIVTPLRVDSPLLWTDKYC